MRRPLRVLQSFPEPRSTTNPYVVMLLESLRAVPELEVATFRWGRALLGRYDVLHLHWPEILVTGRDPVRQLVRRLLVAVLLLRLTLRRTPLVRTLHNLHPQEDRSGVAAALLRGIDRRTTAHIRLNDRTPDAGGVPAPVIPHGHYREWFRTAPRRESEPGHLVFAGLIRPYKNVPELIAAFGQAARDRTDLSLHVAGAPHSTELADDVRRAAATVERVTLSLRHLDDADLVEAVTRAELVVLPYREMHNSGAALMALSLDRPVLVPDNPVNADLAEEVGPGWVVRYPGELSADVLCGALSAVRAERRAAQPDLSRREWASTGAAHLAAYRQAQRAAAARRRGVRRYSR